MYIMQQCTYMEVSFLRTHEVQSTSEHWLQCGLCSLFKIVVMRVQAWSQSALGQNLPLENLVWWVSGCRKCLGSWGCIVDYTVEELQSAAWPAAESLQVYKPLQLRPNSEPLISDITGTQDQPEKWITHAHKTDIKKIFCFW